jgi:hypothetical protein
VVIPAQKHQRYQRAKSLMVGPAGLEPATRPL